MKISDCFNKDGKARNISMLPFPLFLLLLERKAKFMIASLALSKVLPLSEIFFLAYGTTPELHFRQPFHLKLSSHSKMLVQFRIEWL